MNAELYREVLQAVVDYGVSFIEFMEDFKNHKKAENLDEAGARLAEEFADACREELEKPQECVWKFVICVNDFDTSCGELTFNSGLMQTNQFKFCPYCGKPIRVEE